MAEAASVQASPADEMITVFKSEDDFPALAPYPPFAEADVLAGNPNGHLGNVLYRDPSRRFSIGIWECPPGKFIDRATGTELSHVLQGSATLSHEGTGEAKRIEAGDHFYCVYGETIIWEVHETFKKVYVVYEHDWNDERFY
jgi:uncharacterized cupin superfamily protein